MNFEATQLLITLILVGSIVDWIFQLEWVFKNKNNKLSTNLVRRYTLALHSVVYATLTYIITLTVLQKDFGVHIWLALLISHVYIDSRHPINFILKVKGVKEKDYLNYKDYGYLITAVDQRLHEAVIFAIVAFEYLIIR